jgi:hypothetical protein
MRTAQKFSGICALGLFGLMSACSDPVPPASQASVSLRMSAASMPATASCTPGAHWVNLPYASARGQQTSATSRGAVAVDGQDQMSVKCTVKDNGAGAFSVDAVLKSPATSSTGAPVSPTNLTLSATIAPDQGNAMGSVTIQDADTANSFVSTDCVFNVHAQRAGIDQLAIAPGRVWAAVKCPTLRELNASDPNAVCQVESGFAVLENCLQ